MERRMTALERAFELARSGKCLSVLEIQKRLKSEHLETSHLEGPTLKKQLIRLIAEARRQSTFMKVD